MGAAVAEGARDDGAGRCDETICKEVTIPPVNFPPLGGMPEGQGVWYVYLTGTGNLSGARFVL